MENQEINVHLTEITKSIEILKGEALPRKEPRRVLIDGLLSAPYEFLEKRKPDPNSTHVIVDKARGGIELFVNEKSHYSDVIKGSLETDPAFDSFGINSTCRVYTTFELADFIKMNRSYFANKSDAIQLVSELKSFKAKVDKEIENSDDNRCMVKFLRSQVVESNIPNSFDLNMRIFKGQEPVRFSVEVNISSENFNCSLISPEANDYIIEQREKSVGKVIDEIKSNYPEIPILEC